MAAHDWEGRLVADRAGTTFGRITDVFVDKDTHVPALAIVGIDDGRVAVPLDGALESGGLVTLRVALDRVRAAPRVREDADELPPEALERVRAFFAPSADEPTTPMAPAVGAPVAEVVLSEEQVDVAKERRAAEHVHVRKRVVTEEVTLRIELQREELVVEREPIAPGAPGAEPVPEALTDGEPLVITLFGEEPVLQRRIVPVERVVLRKGTVIEHERIVAEVDREVAEVDGRPLEGPAPDGP